MLIELSQVHKGIGLEFKNLAPDNKKKKANIQVIHTN